jgi:hypothetical protein
MITMMKASIIVVSLLAPVALHASIVYSNTTTDTGGTVFYSTGPYVQIGDNITLSGTERSANSATAEFFNLGPGSGTFDATLRFFDLGSPVGPEIGGPFTVTGTAITSGNVVDVTWNLGGLVLPTNVIFTISEANVASALDLGLTFFEPPTAGSSNNDFYIVSTNGTTYFQASQGNHQDNLFFSLDASAVSVPEPGTMLLTLLALPVIAGARKWLW